MKGQKWYEVANEKLNIVLEVKPKIMIDEYLDGRDKSIRARDLTSKIKEVLERNLQI